MLRLMEYRGSDGIKELKLTAKWSVNSDEKKRAILQLLRYGVEARPAIEEILSITAYDDVKQACLDAIRSLGKEQKDKAANKIPRKRIAKMKKHIRKKKLAK